MVLIRQNKGVKIILHAKSPTFRGAKLKGITVSYSKIFKYKSSIRIMSVPFEYLKSFEM